MSGAYYNENDPKAAAWLRELIKAGHIAVGDVDNRSIEDVTPNELAGYRQCHFFAGIGGWSYALRLAGWPDDRPVRTGSCPCQPFSAAGKGKGFADERHLWPSWLHLIRERRPNVIVGEQVANVAAWWDLVSADLEVEGYTAGAAIVGAHSVGAPHIRQRLYWVAYHHHRRREGVGSARLPDGEQAQRHDADGRSAVCGLGDSSSGGRRDPGAVPRAQGSAQWRVRCIADQFVVASSDDLGHAGGERLEGRSVPGSRRSNERAPWTPSDFIWCRDGKWRQIEPGTFPLAHGVPERVGLLRGYGNAIVPQVAAAFIEATGLLA